MKLTDKLPEEPTLRAIIIELRKAKQIQKGIKQIIQQQALDDLFDLGSDEIQDDFGNE